MLGIVLRLLVLAVCAAVPRAASAQDREEVFTGAYAGGQMAYLWLDQAGAAQLPDRVGAGGLHAGVTTRLSDTLIGAEIELDTQDRLLANRAEVLHGLARLKLRAGRAESGIFAYGVFGLSHVDTTLGIGTGISFGVGAETAIGGNWRLGAEILHDRIDDVGSSGQDLGMTSLNFRASFGF